MSQKTIVVSTIGVALKRQGIGVSDLQRRLAARGIRVGRGALDRLASDRPLKSVSFDLLVPVLDELGITLGDPFLAMHDDELAEREATRTLAREVTQSLANGQPSQAISGVLDEADRADHESSQQIDSLIRRNIRRPSTNAAACENAHSPARSPNALADDN